MFPQKCLLPLHVPSLAMCPRPPQITSLHLHRRRTKKNPREQNDEYRTRTQHSKKESKDSRNSTLLRVGEESLAISRIQLGLRVVLWRIFTARPPRWGLWYSREYGNARTYIALRLTSNFDWCDPISWFYEAMQLRLDHTF